MRWIRKRWAIVAAFIVIYFILVHADINRIDVLVVLPASVAIVLGSAFADRLSFDPSAIFVAKPWRVLQPSAGDTFRLTTLGLVTGALFAIFLMAGNFSGNIAAIEGGFIFLFLLIIEILKYQVAQVRWHGTLIDIRSRFGWHHSVKWTELVSVRRDTLGDCIEFRDRKGRKFKINRYLRGYSEFVRDAERYCIPDVKAALRAVK